ncbi:MAG: DUF3592 domain-containing protein [Candidatus Marinimicrobia bacterium]|nr:DUF3592 domain-containing protein [Candidatus Neomarinimicrobiota bacterium]
MTPTLAELKPFLETPPPRLAPPLLLKRALRGGPAVLLLLGGFLSLFGLLFLTIFFPRQVADEIRLNRRAQRDIEARVTAAEATSFRENEQRVYRYAFDYTGPDGIRRTGMSYRTGGPVHAEGELVPLEYLPGRPAVARLAGGRLSPFGWGAAAVAVFPLVGLGMLFFALRTRARIRFLLRHGFFSLGRIETVEPTNVRVNNQLRYRVRLVYDADGTPQIATYNAYGADVPRAQEACTAQTPVGLLYDPAHPSRILPIARLTA